jgi:hypothetical protein
MFPHCLSRRGDIKIPGHIGIAGGPAAGHKSPPQVLVIVTRSTIGFQPRGDWDLITAYYGGDDREFTRLARILPTPFGAKGRSFRI